MLSCFYLSNVVVRFDILSDDENIRKGVMSVLKEEGVETGTYIPSIDLIVTERALKQKVEGISWAGITRKGDTLIIDVIETEGTQSVSQTAILQILLPAKTELSKKSRFMTDS